MIVPDPAGLLSAGDAIPATGARWGAHPRLAGRDFGNVVLIAVSFRRRGAVLLSRDADRSAIAQFVGRSYSPVLPVA